LQLVNGWPTAPYWHTLSQKTTPSCPGQVITTNTWLGKDGTEISGDEISGPQSSNPTSSCYDPQTGYYPMIGASSGITIGGHRYSWAEFAALPTDPAKLWPLLRADANPGGTPSKVDLYTAYWYIVKALTSDPIAPAMRMALFKVMAKFPSVHVTGKYTDSLGRRHYHLGADAHPHARVLASTRQPNIPLFSLSTVDQERGRSLIPLASKPVTSAIRAARKSGRRFVASM
jgi:hypothetical protein